MRWFNYIAGYAKYATLPRLPDSEQARRVGICAACPNARLFDEREVGKIVTWAVGSPRALWCGAPGTTTPATCGCCVGAESGPDDPTHATVTVHGRSVPIQAAMKTEVDSPCPSGRF